MPVLLGSGLQTSSETKLVVGVSNVDHCEKMRIFDFLFSPPFLRGVNGLSVHEAEHVFLLMMKIKPG